MVKHRGKRDLLGLVAWLGASFAVAAVGAFASAEAAVFYRELVRPAWAPPGGLFAPVWSTLFALMGIAAWRVWRRAGFRGARNALGLFSVQLAVNGLWSWLFFAWHRGAWALLDVVLLWGLIVATLVAFSRHDRLAALLLVPYLAWVSFAAVLNYRIWQLNPGLLGG